jgi:hypothetical protein
VKSGGHVEPVPNRACLSLEVMGEAMHFFAEMARSEKDLDRRGEYYRDASNIAVKLAPFRYPTYSSVKVGGDRQSPLEALEGKTSQQAMLELLELIKTTGVLPKRLAAMMNCGVINVSPQRLENGSG